MTRPFSWDSSSLHNSIPSMLADTYLHDGFQDTSVLSALPIIGQTALSDFDIRDADNALGSISNISIAVSSPLTPSTSFAGPKLGTRFSRDVIRTLKTWLAAHQHHPYPRDDDIMTLQRRTGLSQAQLANWFANARRRGKAQEARPASPQVRNNATSPIDIIQRPGTPAVGRDHRTMNPMQRWVDSPPEQEPADIGDIARAMASNPTNQSAYQSVIGIDYSANDPWRTPYDMSSASSAGTSQSSGISTHHSSASQSSLKVRRPTRRKRAHRRRRTEGHSAVDYDLPYQCTFCTATFKTKFDWQRHEKSLHLPLEQWVCGFQGPRATKPEITSLCCAFCGETAPDDAHIESHHYSSCVGRGLDERTFHRKDHLVQHLRLVHNAKFESWSMKSWMIPIPDVKSRCGFCTREMCTWVERTEHLGEHFKAGATMADWKGDWGFDNAVLQMVENSVPPYFIEYERNTLVPMKATDSPWGSPPNTYELIKIETEFFIQIFVDTHRKMPTNDAIQLDACRVVFAAEAAADVEAQGDYGSLNSHESWFRDLIMSSNNLATQARFGPLRTASESRHQHLRANGKAQLFQNCELENSLRAFVQDQKILGRPITDAQLQTQMCEIIRKLEATSLTPSDMFANWLVKGIYSTPTWLASFKERTGLIGETEVLEIPADMSLQPSTKSWICAMNETASQLDTSNLLPTTNVFSTFMPDSEPDDAATRLLNQTMFNINGRPTVLLPDDTNFHRVFETDLKRWIAATMSPKNPNCHIPSDEEIQHQARWIMYGDDDPWNQTPADMPEFLWRLKHDVGIVADIGVVNTSDLMKI